MRVAMSWITGISAFVVLLSAFTALGNLIGVPVQILFDEPVIIETRYYEEEKDGAFTSFGLCALIVSVMLASRVGMAVLAKSWRGNVGRHGEIQFLAWLVGLSALGCFAAILYLAFRDFHGTISNILFNLLDLAAALGIAWSAKTWHDQRVLSLEASSRRALDHAAVRVFMSEAHQCARAMLENSSYILRELRNVIMDDETLASAKELCSSLVGTSHETTSELHELGDVLHDGAAQESIRPTVARITERLSNEVMRMHKLVTNLDAAARQDMRRATAFVLVSESAANVINCFNSTKKSADATRTPVD